MKTAPATIVNQPDEPTSLQRLLVDELVLDYLLELENSDTSVKPVAEQPTQQE